MLAKAETDADVADIGASADPMRCRTDSLRDSVTGFLGNVRSA
jgi:hypothetical protein